MWLPSSLDLTGKELEKICSQIKNFINQKIKNCV